MVFVFCVLWSYGGLSILESLKQRFSQLGLSPVLANWILLLLPLLLLLLLFVEVGLKVILLRAAFTPAKFIPTSAEACTYINQNELSRYTSDLVNMGFIPLTDYTTQDETATARLFSHPEHFCFAEVGQQEGFPSTFCSISSLLENDWAMGITNAAVTPSVEAISFAFFRQSRVLVKGEEDASLPTLFHSLLNWRKKVCEDLGVLPRLEMNAEAYFDFERHKRIQQRRRFMFRSVIWTLLEMQWFTMYPQSEWLGDYQKLKRPRT